MSKKRVYELAKELNLSSKEIVTKAHSVGINLKNHMSSLSESDEAALRKKIGSSGSVKENKQTKNNQPVNKTNSTNQNRKDGADKPKQNQPKHQQANRSEKGAQQQRRKPQQQGGQGQQQRSGQSQQQRGGQGQQQRSGQSQQQRSGQGQQQRSGQGKQQRGGQSQQQRGGQSQQQRGGQGQQQRGGQSQQQRGGQSQQQRGGQSQQQRGGQGQQQRGGQSQQQRSGQGQQQSGRRQDNRGKQQGSFHNKNRFNKKGRKGKRGQQQSNKPAVPPRKFRELPEVLVYTEGMNVAEISKKIYREPAEIIKKLFMLGIVVNQNQALNKDTIELLAADYGIEAEEKIQEDIADIDKFFEPEALSQENLVTRPPVVTIMGHVDHGKTTLLDTLRHTKVSLGEAGGITQHIGAYQIDVEGKPITFLDTPGHAAFTSMRARGAKITDITILVVAADDGVMPQTIEAINHAKAAEVPIIVAVNKIDKPTANPDRVMQELSEHGLIPEDWGGDTIFVPISAKFGDNIDELLEMVLLVSEVEDLKADPTQKAIGTVIEARLDKSKGPIVTLLIQNGTLHVGDPIVVGNTFGKVRVMTNDIGRRDKEAGPATPVEITGLNDVPQAGDRFVVFDDEKSARAAGEERAKRALLEQRAASSRVTLDNLFESLKEGELKEVNVIIKADVQGSAEALAASLNKIDVEGVRIKIVHSAVGAINESDITLASASNAIIIGFNVRPTPQAKTQAEQEHVDIRLHRIIYKVIEEIETAMKGMLDPEYEEKITGQMVVRETYKVSKLGTIGGCYVTEGSIFRDGGIRLIRDGIVIHEGKLASLKRFKDDVKEVKLGFECGAMIEGYNDIKVDDVIEGYIMEEIKIS